MLALDRDPAAIAAAEQNLAGLPVKVAQANFCDLGDVLDELQIRRRRWRAARPGPVERSTGRRVGGVQLRRRAARSTCGSIPRKASRPGSCWPACRSRSWPT